MLQAGANLDRLGSAEDQLVHLIGAWGNPIHYAAEVRYGGYPADDYLPRTNYPLFASAGPDGQIGSANPGASAAQKALAQDNLYSIEIK